MSVISEKWNYFLSYFRIFAICDGEIIRLGKKTNEFLCFALDFS